LQYYSNNKLVGPSMQEYRMELAALNFSNSIFFKPSRNWHIIYGA